MLDALSDATSRSAFTRSLRAVLDGRGQVITFLDRCYLTRTMPTLLVWGSRDAVVPVRHARRAHTAMPGSRLEIFDGVGHFPFHADPARFIAPAGGIRRRNDTVAVEHRAVVSSCCATAATRPRGSCARSGNAQAT